MTYLGILIVVLTVGCSAGHMHQRSDRAEQTTAARSPHEPAGSNPSHGSGLPMPLITISEEGVSVPFRLDEQFAVPHIEVMIQGKGPYRFAFDTGMSGTVMIRPKLAEELGLPVIGRAMIGDGSGKHNQATDLVLISSMSLGAMKMANVIAIAVQASEAHLKEVPENLSGILGRGLVKDYLLTIDYPRQMITIEPGQLDARNEHVIGFDFHKGAMQISANLSGIPYQLLVDTGSRGSITLPRSAAETLPLTSTLKQSHSVSTVTNTYQIFTSILSGSLDLAGFEVGNPTIMFAEEHTPRLIGYEILKGFAFTVDQKQRLIRFDG